MGLRVTHLCVNPTWHITTEGVTLNFLAILRKSYFIYTSFIRANHWQEFNLNDAMRVLQLNVPLLFKYSVVNQKVLSSTGSTVRLL